MVDINTLNILKSSIGSRLSEERRLLNLINIGKKISSIAKRIIKRIKFSKIVRGRCLSKYHTLSVLPSLLEEKLRNTMYEYLQNRGVYVAGILGRSIKEIGNKDFVVKVRLGNGRYNLKITSNIKTSGTRKNPEHIIDYPLYINKHSRKHIVAKEKEYLTFWSYRENRWVRKEFVDWRFNAVHYIDNSVKKIMNPQSIQRIRKQSEKMVFTQYMRGA